ncbi:MAG: hypothetical protein ACRDT8_17875, partial [Micromonosporaceae bacterium]
MGAAPHGPGYPPPGAPYPGAPYPGQGGTFPPHGAPYPPPGAAPQKKTGLLLAGVAAALALVLVGGLVVVLLGGGSPGARFDDSAQKAAKRAAAELTAAARDLAAAPGIRYEGSYTDTGGDQVPVTAQLTNRGWTVATVDTDDGEAKVFSNGLRTYVKASKEYWDNNQAPIGKEALYAKQWVKVAPDHFDVNLTRLLTPALLGADLGVAVERGEAELGETTTINGVETREVITPLARVYVTNTEPKKIVRIVSSSEEASPEPSDDGGGQGGGGTGRTMPARASWQSGAQPQGASRPGHLMPVRMPTDRDFEFDVSGLSDGQLIALARQLKKQVKGLKGAIDSRVNFELVGSISLKPCNSSGCTANLTIKNEVEEGSPYTYVDETIYANVTIEMTLDGNPIKTCKITKKMETNNSAKVKCRATYTLSPGKHVVRAKGLAVARDLAEAAIKQMAEALQAEAERIRKSQGDSPRKDDLGPTFVPCDVRETTESTRCLPGMDDLQDRLGGGTIEKILPPMGAGELGAYRGVNTGWTSHTVLVKDGRVYDGFTSRYGESIAVYK